MSFLTDQEANALSIVRMTLHVVGEAIDFLPQPELDLGEHVPFFISRIKDVASSSVHCFAEGSPTKQLLEEMGSGQRKFLDGAQELSRRFAQSHGGSSSTGAFFVIELRGGSLTEQLYCLVKYDYREAVELSDASGKQMLRTIVQAFVKERNAIQKACLVRVKNGIADLDVSAVDRMGKAPDLTNYFGSYLDVSRARSDAELSTSLKEAIRSTLSACKSDLPLEDVNKAYRAARDALRGQSLVNEASIRDAIRVAAGMPEDEDTAAKLDRTLLRNLRKLRLEGVEFLPDQKVFFDSAPRRRLKTAEGVEIVYPGEQENERVRREPLSGGGLRITITTAESLIEDAALPERTGR